MNCFLYVQGVTMIKDFVFISRLIKCRNKFVFHAHALRWLDTVFQGQYLPSLSVNYVAINKDLEKLTPQLY